jgi:endoglucanase
MPCADEAAPVAQSVPLILGELGEDDGGHAFVDSLMDRMDARPSGSLAWVWDVRGSPLDLIASYDGTPTADGLTFKNRFNP